MLKLNYRFVLTTAILFGITNHILMPQTKGVSDPFQFPSITITREGNPSGDYLFLGISQGITSSLLILDNNLTPVFGKHVEGTVYDFSLQGDGTLAYNVFPDQFWALDSSGTPVKRYSFPDDTYPDIHDIQVMQDGSYYVIGKEVFNIDMRKYVPNGDPNAQIIANSIHYMSPYGKELWNWSAKDNLTITDCDDNVDLLLHTIDWTHFNSTAISPDGNILVSIRNFSEIIKINRITGRVMWHLGGRNNSFRFINDFRGFSRQHDIQVKPNGHLLFFDNGCYLSPQYSSAVEYELNEIEKTAALIRRYTRNESVFTESMGSIRQLRNGNWLIGWGENQNPCITEVDSTGATQLELQFILPTFQYRAAKHPWHTNYFNINHHFFRFDSLLKGKSSSRRITLNNPHSYPVEINDVHFQTSIFSLKDDLPVIIQPGKSISLSIRFNPAESGHYEDRMTIGYNSDTLLLAQQVELSGIAYTGPLTTAGTSGINSNFTLLQNFPNPFNPATTIEYSTAVDGELSLRVFDFIGNEVALLACGYKKAGNYHVTFDGSRLSSGIYFCQLKNYANTMYKKMCLLK